jgi:glutamate-1-semialdehyde 2,1-aminomutase
MSLLQPATSEPLATRDLTKSRALQTKSHSLIPGGAHTYAKGDDQFPDNAPGFIERGRGCHVWDIDGNEYIEYGMGLRAVTLGHAYPSVVQAANAQMQLGSNFTRPAPIEVECAESLLSFIDGDDQAKFTKDGSTATTAAVKLARAYTGRNKVALCSDHGFLSYDDWFIGTTEMDSGIPELLMQLTTTFRYNNLESVERVFSEHPGEIACLILEPARTEEPRDGFLHKTQELCRKYGALLILDENITGFRWHIGGAQKYYDIVPDLSIFGKAIANGFALSALVGKREIMDLGGIKHDRERVFLLSTTHGGETHALAAAVATMQVYREEPVIEHLYRQGRRLTEGVFQATERHGLQGYVGVTGHPPNLVYYTFDQEKRPSQAFRSLFLQEIIQRGILAPSFVVSYSHSDEDIDRTIDAVDGALKIYVQAMNDGTGTYLQGRPSKEVFRKYN